MGGRCRGSSGRRGPVAAAPPAGYFTKRLAEDWLRDLLDQARRGALPGLVRTGATFADAAAEHLRYIEQDRRRKPSTLRGYRSALEAHLLPAFGSMPVEEVTTRAIETWAAALTGSPRHKNKLLIEPHGILQRAKKLYGLPANAASEIEKFPVARSCDIDVFSPEEVWALVRAAESEQDGAIFLTAAFTGLRMGELLALRWRDIDFAGRTIRVRASYYLGQTTTPKSGKVRAVPMAPDIVSALAGLGQREHWVAEDDLVFVGVLGDHLDGSALRRRYKEALHRAGATPPGSGGRVRVARCGSVSGIRDRGRLVRDRTTLLRRKGPMWRPKI
jgi:integrase